MSTVTSIRKPETAGSLRQEFSEAMKSLQKSMCVMTVATQVLSAKHDGGADVAVELEALLAGIGLLDTAYDALDSVLVRLSNEDTLVTVGSESRQLAETLPR